MSLWTVILVVVLTYLFIGAVCSVPYGEGYADREDIGIAIIWPLFVGRTLARVAKKVKSPHGYLLTAPLFFASAVKLAFARFGSEDEASNS